MTLDEKKQKLEELLLSYGISFKLYEARDKILELFKE